MDEWLDGFDGRGRQTAFLHGAPGIGKSTFAINYANNNHHAAAVLVCRYGADYYNDPANVIRTLAYLLAYRLPQYRKGLVNYLRQYEEKIHRIEDAGSPIPIAKNTLKKLAQSRLGWSGSQFAAFIKKIEGFLIYDTNKYSAFEGSGDQTLQISHKYFYEWLRDDESQYYSDPEDGQRYIAEYLMG